MIKKTAITMCLGALFISGKVNAQESCDSTCYSPAPLRGGYTTTKKSGTQIIHNYNDYSVRYEYQTQACPSGYQGRGGGVGSITERRSIINFKNGRVDIGEWIALSDNCEIIPAPPPPPPPPPAPAAPSVVTKAIFACNWGYGNNSVGCPFSPAAVSSWPVSITARWTFLGYDSQGKPYGNLSYDNMIPMEKTNHPQSHIALVPTGIPNAFPVSYLENWQYAEVRNLYQPSMNPYVMPLAMPLEVFQNYVNGVTQFAITYDY